MSNPNNKKNIEKTVRYQAMVILEKIEKSGSYSNLLINHTIETYRFNSVDARLLTELVYGVLQRKLTLDYYLSAFIKKNQSLDSWVRNLLRLSFYQMIYLERIPNHAIFNEAVNIAKKRGHFKGISQFVNGVLRNAERRGFLSIDAIQDPIEKLSVEFSMPEHLVKKLTDELGIEKTRSLGLSLLEPSHPSARINSELITMDEALRVMRSEGFDPYESELSNVGIVADSGHFVSSSLFKEGKLTIQDESSQLVAPALEVEPFHQVLDACAAPGGKTTHIASYLSEEAGGKVTALDLHAHKVKLIEENAERMHVKKIVNGQNLDARKVNTAFKDESFDRILVDAPCSGLGLMRRKPDIKYTKNEGDFVKLQKIQVDILTQVAPKLKKDGLLVYSTCTITNEENEQVISKFLKNQPNFSKVPIKVGENLQANIVDNALHIYPDDFNTDGFFICCLKRNS